jgi:hypothetical protein
VWSSNANRVAYLDGVAGTPETTARTVSSIDSFRIGARVLSGTEALYFNGDIGHVTVWNVALTAGQLLKLAKGMAHELMRPSRIVFNVRLNKGGPVLSKTRWQGNALMQVGTLGTGSVMATSQRIQPAPRQSLIAPALAAAAAGARSRFYYDLAAQSVGNV